MEEIGLVWFKKDLRLHDHAPLSQAVESGLPLLLVYIFEPSLQKYPDWDLRHWRFVYHSILHLNQNLEPYQTKIHFFFAEVEEVLEDLRSKVKIHTIFSHQETGVQLTFQRDEYIVKYCQKYGIIWKEYQSNGVKRGLSNRLGWDKAWEKYMNEPLQNPVLGKLKTIDFQIDVPFMIPYTLRQKLEKYPTFFQPAGEFFAWKYLKSFVEKRAENYTRHLSKPELSRFSCSRISPYLTWGNLSSRQVYQYYQKKLPSSPFKRPLQNFRSRLQWRCHFIQKFEMEDRMEFEHLNKGYFSLAQPLNERYLEAWQNAQTGYPLVDACMRSVIATGFLNFRMRAMLVSFLTHLLWQPWQAGVHFLARQFLDYEVGIHFAQFQMQAGVTGINTVRVYNPVKQSQEHDQEANFIKKWLPELAKVPSLLVHTPWEMSQIEQSMYHCKIGMDYPLPIIQHILTAPKASKILWEMRKDPNVVKENKRILRKHVKPR